MNSADTHHAKSLREALHELYHSGPDGFEGFVSVVLGNLTGQSFRLARSGTQRGRDGDSAFDGGATYFEGKRYNESPSKSDIFAKLGDLAADDAGQVDLWVLGATCEVAAQTVADAKAFAAKCGIGIVILDWSNNDLGSLLVASVNAGDDAKSFITDGLHKTGKSSFAPAALAAIDYFSAHAQFPARLHALRRALSIEESGLAHARILNRAWMERIFSSRRLARAEFGQPLAPLDPDGLKAMPRLQRKALCSAFVGQSPTEIYAVIGDEGTGKSWICAQTWIEAHPSSLLILCPADDLLSAQATDNFEAFLISRLIKQTGGQESERLSERWRRRLRGWRANPAPENVRVTLVADGLNQPRKSDWSRWLDRAAAELHTIGGCLVVTTRKIHWSELRRSLTSKIDVVTIDVWSKREVETHLRGSGIDPHKVSAQVLETLRNPRLLGIAIDLLAAKDVEQLNELSVGRLMFEHMRKAQQTGAAPLSGVKFAEFLKKLAEEAFDRVRSQKADDLKLFDVSAEEGLEAVATSRFFGAVPGASLQYEIKSEGLNVGLALFLISELEKEHRNGRCPEERLQIILEPIGALDEAAKVVLTAIQVASLEESSGAVQAALIEHLASLQNLPSEEVDAFAWIVKTSTSPLLVAARNIYSSETHFPNADWLLYALLKYRDDPDVWAIITEHIKQWLSIYSLAPERMMFKTAGRDKPEEVAEERVKREEKTAEAVAKLTPQERQYIEDNLIKTEDWAFATLHQTAFSLLAGMPLREFAGSFMRWTVADALDPALQSADKEFRQLVRFNKVDWAQTRTALLEELKFFTDEATSSVGKWARVEILRAIGSLEEAKHAEDLADWLTRDREKFVGFSLQEKYCSADPCDPTTAEPGNVKETAMRYRSIDPSSLYTAIGQAQADHFFDMARCGVARFYVDDALAAHRALADDVLTRDGLPRRQGTLGLLEHSAVLTDDQVKRLLHSGQASTVSFKDDQELKPEWLAAQYSIRTAIVHLTPDEQLEAIASIQGNTVLIDTLLAVKPALEAKVEQVLERVFQEGNPDHQSSVLAAIQYSRPPLSPRSVGIVSQLCRSPVAIVRAQSLGIAAFSGDHALLKEIADGNWDTRKLTAGKQKFEHWYGSAAILEAAKAGLLEMESALDRMNLDHYGFAAQQLGAIGARSVADRVEAALHRALAYQQKSGLPEMETIVSDPAHPGPPLISLGDPPPQNQEERWQRFGETSAEFNDRQKRAADAFKSFADQLTSDDARLILEDLTFGGMTAMIAANPDAGKRWLDMFDTASDRQLQHLHHVALQLAIALVVSNVIEAKALLERVLRLDPTIRRVSGAAKISAESLMLWANTDASFIEETCLTRLVTRHKDSDISKEVLAAHLNGKQDIVFQVIIDLLAKGEPVDVCLALTLAGYCDSDPRADALIGKYEGAVGFIGTAHRAAKTAYGKNKWSKVWYEKMLTAKEPAEFWQASLMLTKVVDARYDVWSDRLGPVESPLKSSSQP